LVVVFDLDLGLGRNVEIISIIKEHVSAVGKHHGGLLGLCQEVGLVTTCGNPEFFHEKNTRSKGNSVVVWEFVVILLARGSLRLLFDKFPGIKNEN